ncbi:MAG: acyltransferase family protein [Verrucomicrobiaceae bacterium]|nr:acyltransferase family protein [Verrucomicrobiaceae bacterium]
MQPSRPEPLPALTSLRFFAAALVILFHYLPRNETNTAWYLNVINHGYVGVSFFFVLSGFILAYTGRQADFTIQKTRLTFYARRIARVFPAFFIATLLQWPLFANYEHATLSPHDSLVRVLLVTCLTFALVQSWFPWSLGQLNAPSWTISVEMFLYASFPLAATMARKLKPKTILLSGLLCWSLCWLPAAAAPWVSQWFLADASVPTWLHSPFSVASTWLNCFPLFHLPQFCIGIFAGTWVVRPTNGREADVRSGIAAIVAVLTALLLLAVPRKQFALLDMALNHGVLALCFATLFSAIAIVPDAAWQQPLKWRPLVILGDASYALYIFQMPVMQATTLVFKKMGSSTESLSLFITGFMVLIGVSLISWKLEPWARSRLYHRLERTFLQKA